MTIEIKNELRNFSYIKDYQRAKFWFLPIVIVTTIFFGIFDGVKGALVGFLYGVVAGLFFIHESLSAKRKMR